MKKIIPFKKDILFKNTIEEITSISMDHHLENEEYSVKGDFIVEGEYVSSGSKDKFHFEIPYLGYIEDRYDISAVTLDIDDFYYEITEPNKLSIHVDILVDKLTEKPLIEEIETIPVIEEDVRTVEEEKEEERDSVKEEEVKEEEKEERMNEEVTQVFSNQNSLEEAYMTYKVYIVREGDTVSSILEKYQITEENLRKYNVINELSFGDKLIIPNEKN